MFGLGGFGLNSYYSYYSIQHRRRLYRASKSSKTNEGQQETEEDDMIQKDAEYAIISKMIEEPCFITLHKFVNRMANALNDHGKMLLAYGVKGAEERDSKEDYKVRVVNSWQGDVQEKQEKNDNMKYPEFLIDVSKIVSAVESYQETLDRNYSYICKCTCLYTNGLNNSSWNIIEPVEEVYRLIEEATAKKFDKIMEMTKKLRALQLQDNPTQQEQETEGL